MKNSDFIEQMVQETLDIENESSSIQMRFKLDEVFEIDAVLDDERSCYILKGESGRIEIPMNWGPFHNRIGKEIIIHANEDQVEFLKVLSSFLKIPLEAIRINLIKDPIFDDTKKQPA